MPYEAELDEMIEEKENAIKKDSLSLLPRNYSSFIKNLFTFYAKGL